MINSIMLNPLARTLLTFSFNDGFSSILVYNLKYEFEAERDIYHHQPFYRAPGDDDIGGRSEAGSHHSRFR